MAVFILVVQGKENGVEHLSLADDYLDNLLDRYVQSRGAR
jgi:hypothetical protein